MRGDFLFRLGRLSEAKIAFDAAVELARNDQDKAFLCARSAACDPETAR
ncbi:MAG: hypothetical protein ABI832_01265 [bacterium]